MTRAVVRFGLLRDGVGPGMCSAGSAEVGPVARLISGDVDLCGKTLVVSSLEAGTSPNTMVPASRRLIKVEPSTRQYASVSSFSRRLHWGQRFMKGWRQNSFTRRLTPLDQSDYNADKLKYVGQINAKHQDKPCSRGSGDAGPSGILSSCCSGIPLRYWASRLSGSISTPAGLAAKASDCM